MHQQSTKTLQCGNEKTNMPKQAFSVPWIRFLNSPGLLQKLLHCDHIEMLNKTHYSKNLNWQYLWKSGFEVCSNRVQIPSSQVWASEKPPKLCLEVYLHSIKPLKAQVIEISSAENVIFKKNLLHCTATPPQIMKMWVYKPFTLFPSRLYLTEPKT